MKDDINGLVFCGFIFVLLLVLSMYLRSGRGAALISIYNIMPKSKRALYNEKALCKFTGNLLFFIDFILIFAVIAGIFELTWLIIMLVVGIITVSIISTFYVFTDPKFRN